MLVAKWIFVLFHIITTFFVIFLLFCINTVYCLFSLIGIILCTVILLLITNCEFFALVYLLIYIGAIVVFFLFTIMLLHLRFERVFDFDMSHAFALPCFILLNFLLAYFIMQDFSYMELRRNNIDLITSTVIDAVKHSTWMNPAFNSFKFESTDAFMHSLKYEATDSAMADYKIIGFVMYQKFGYFCFLVSFILLMTMIGIMQIIKFVREEAATDSSAVLY